MERKKIAKQGFTLIEIMIALTILAGFLSIFLSSSGNNVLDSMKNKEDLKLRELAVQVMNEVILGPKNFKETLTSPDVKTFEKDQDYSYSITYKKFKLPPLTGITSKSDDEGADSTPEEDSNENPIMKKVYKQIKENLEKIIWQIMVEIKNKQTGEIYLLSTWVHNEKEKVQFNGI